MVASCTDCKSSIALRAATCWRIQSAKSETEISGRLIDARLLTCLASKADRVYSRFIRWSLLGVFDRIFASLAGDGPKPERIMIDTTHLNAHTPQGSTIFWPLRLDATTQPNFMFLLCSIEDIVYLDCREGFRVADRQEIGIGLQAKGTIE
jgi:hypothetical protein